MPKIEIYTWKTCPYCVRAKALLDAKDADYTEYAIDGDDEARAKMSERSHGRRTVPQIFIDGKHIGGCDDLHQLEQDGRLDTLLAS